MNLTEGQVLAQKYRIERVLGRGGMGVVVCASHLQLGERVALKFLLPEALDNREAVERFAREARAAVRIKSEHVARVSDVGTLENGAPYMVMEYLEGADLAHWLQQRGPLPVEQAVEFVLQASEAIAEAHALGIVHRDLKPANLFVIQRADGGHSVKVLDFGISKATGLGSSGSMTTTSAVMGSPYYMSPEQMASSKDADARSDIWALGVVLHELLSGVYPFQANAMPELILKIAMSPAMRLTAAMPGAPLGLEKVILKCLEKDRANRYPTIGALALALLEFGPRRSKTSVERISGIMQRAGMSATVLELPLSSDAVETRVEKAAEATQASWGHTAAPQRNRRRVMFGLVGSLVAIGAAITGYSLTRGQPSPLATTTDASSVPAHQQARKSAPLEATIQAAVPGTASLEVPVIAPTPSAPSAVASQRVLDKPARVERVGIRPHQPIVTTSSGSPPSEAGPKAATVSPLKMKLE